MPGKKHMNQDRPVDWSRYTADNARQKIWNIPR